MKRSINILLLFIAIATASFAQSVVSNTKWEMDETGEKIVVTYDLNRQGELQYFSVHLLGILDGVEFKARAVSGDVGPYVRFGRKKTIVWEIYKDLAEADGSLSVKIVAENAAPGPVADNGNQNADPLRSKSINKVPVFAGMGGVVLLGGGLFVSGATKTSKAKSEYDDDIRPRYEGIVSPDDAAYREEYTAVNKRYKSGQLLMIGGGAILVGGGYMLIQRLIDLKKIKASSRLDIRPQIDLTAPDVQSGFTAGMRIRYRF